LPLYQQPSYKDRFSSLYPQTKPGVQGDLIMDMTLPVGGVQFQNQLNTTGSGTTSATAGDVTSIAHGLGFKPNFVTLTPTSSGNVYLQASTPFDATNIYVIGSAASLTFLWKAE
jgi:hypothetical protein